MKEKVVELLILIMTEIQEDKQINDIDYGDLKKQGYTQSEISAAFSWIHDNMPSTATHAGYLERPNEGSRRMLHEAEKMMLSTDAQGFLIQLTELNLLTSRDLENVIERAMLSGFEQLRLNDLRAIVASVLLARGGESGFHRDVIDGGDTIH